MEKRDWIIPDINDMLKGFGENEVETGFIRDENGDWVIRMISPMPGINGYRLNWWHCRGMNLGDNFVKWHPGDHKPLPPDDPKQWQPNDFYGTTNHKIQLIGDQLVEIRNHYFYPEEFGFDLSKFKESGVAGCNCTSPLNDDIPLYGQQLIHCTLTTEYGLVRRTWCYLHKKDVPMAQLLSTFQHMFYENASLCPILNEIYEEDPQNKGRAEILPDDCWGKK